LGPVAVLVLEWGATRRRLVSVLGGALVAIAMLGLGQAFALFGYVDVLCAAFVVTGAVALTFRPTDRATVGLAGCALAAAGMTKAEGAVFALVVLGVHLVHRHDRWRTVSALALLVVIPSLAWRSIVFGINPHPASEIDVGNVVEVVRFSGMRMRRLCRAAGHLLRYSPPLVAASVVALLTGRVARSKPGYRRAGVLMIAAWATMFALAMIYAAGDTDLGYWLRTSAERIVTTPVLLALVATAECVLTLVDPRVAASRAGRST
ncbi:MAG TPA: hypothetical protein VK461_11085, partial [Acidimicrobiales bacterium]|nr:hypothetical protein [Acidimicrobiales bacterium]